VDQKGGDRPVNDAQHLAHCLQVGGEQKAQGVEEEVIARLGESLATDKVSETKLNQEDAGVSASNSGSLVQQFR
jgi:oligoribonuclease NrnB/cAMP/cGMP phosphodiesterase (DHH superfamily)